MAFNIRNLGVLAFAADFTLWAYKKTTETREQIAAAGYFDSASDMLSAGDMIMISARDGGAMYFVEICQHGEVRLAAMPALASAARVA